MVEKAKRPSIKDVAKMAGVSITTVSQILNHKSDRFPQETVERVLAAKQELGYIPNKSAQMLRGNTKPLIGVLVPSLRNPFFTDLMQSMEEHTQGKAELIFQAARDDQINQFIEMLVERGVNGLIIARTLPESTPIFDFLKKTGIAATVLDQGQNETFADVISTDDIAGGKLVAEFLAEKGHQKVVLGRPEVLTKNMALRLQGFVDHWRTLGNEAVEIITEMSKHGGQSVTEKVIASGATAAFMINDEMAIGLLRGLHEKGVQVPTYFSVVGYDNTDFAEFVTPTLTTVAQPIWELGEHALDMVLRRLSNSEMEKQTEMLAIPGLVVRESTSTLTE